MKIDFAKYEMMLAAREILCILEAEGFSAVIAGGAVRDLVMGKMPADIDIATNMPVARIEALFPSHDIGKSKDFGLLTIHHKDFQFEVAQFRRDGKYSDGRRPDSVELVSTFKEDAARRDFTINAMGLTKDGEILDFFGGQKDILAKMIRTVGEADARFGEDYLRMLRALRFAAVLDFEIDLGVQESIKANKDHIANVSKERVCGELFKAAKVGKLGLLTEIMCTTGLLKIIIPEVEVLRSVNQRDNVRNIHQEGDAFTHTLLVMRRCPHTVECQFAGLFHDLGKAETRSVSPEGKVQFLRHEEASAYIAEEVMRRLCFSSDMMEKIKVLVGNHMRFTTMEGHVSKAIRKLVRQIGEEAVVSLMDLADADALGMVPCDNYMEQMRINVKEVLESPLPVKRAPVLTGTQIMACLGVAPGRVVGKIKDFLINLEDDFAVEGKSLTVEEAEKAIREIDLEKLV